MALFLSHQISVFSSLQTIVCLGDFFVFFFIFNWLTKWSFLVSREHSLGLSAVFLLHLLTNIIVTHKNTFDRLQNNCHY